MRTPVRVLLVAGITTAVIVAVGLFTLGSPEQHVDARPPVRAAFKTTALASYDTTSARVTRGPFCAALDPHQVAAALGGEPDSSSSWQSGDPVEVADGVEDVGHEFGCEYVGADGTLARAWVFAPPVDADQAHGLAHSAGKAPGCQAADGPPFGDPSIALTCTRDGVARASYRGLFADAWLVCEVVRPAGATWDVVDRAGRWCVGVLEAAGSRD